MSIRWKKQPCMHPMGCDRESTTSCKKCGRKLCESHAYSYVDGNNRAITKNSPEYCFSCYRSVYGVEV